MFNDRRTVAAKIDAISKTFEEVGGLAFADAQRRMEALDTHIPVNILDGPLVRYSMAGYAMLHHLRHTRLIAERRATAIAVALAVYRHDHGRYPSSLDDLLGEYLDAIPLDPFDDQPIRYIPQSDEDDFVLYSIGVNLIDDGGKPPTNKRQPKYDGDRIVGHTRSSNLWSEIKLEKVDP